MRVEDLLEELDKQYPDSALALQALTERERNEYIAKLELIAHIRLIVTPPKKRK